MQVPPTPSYFSGLPCTPWILERPYILCRRAGMGGLVCLSLPLHLLPSSPPPGQLLPVSAKVLRYTPPALCPGELVGPGRNCHYCKLNEAPGSWSLASGCPLNPPRGQCPGAWPPAFTEAGCRGLVKVPPAPYQPFMPPAQFHVRPPLQRAAGPGTPDQDLSGLQVTQNRN